MTTPEQLQAWREKFCTAFNIRLWELQPSGNFSSLGLGREWAGYLRCCQENEQAMKLAKFGAMAARKWINDALDSLVYPDLDVALVESIVMDIISEKDRDLSPEIKKTIKELLNE